jgi:hypothetical protein
MPPSSPTLFRPETTVAAALPTEPANAEDLVGIGTYRAALGRNQLALIRLLPVAAVELSSCEQEAVQVYQMASLVLGPVAQAPMICSDDCPPAFKIPCPLARIGRHPVGERCPFEQQYVSERFLSWMYELDRTLETLMESERSSITTLVMLDLQERRCNAILAQAAAAELSSKSVRDTDYNGKPIAWEDVVHVNAERLNEIIDKRRVMLKDLELTREMATKRQKMLGQLKPGGESSLATRQSDRADAIRRVLHAEPVVVDLSP